MNRKSLFFGLVAITFTQPVLAALTESYICSSCDYNDAKEAVKQFYETPNCSWNNGGGFSHDMTFSCNTSAKDVIVANPVTQTAYKFNVTATNANSDSEALSITATDASLTSIEIDSLETFYHIHAEFLKAANTVVYANNFYSASSLKAASASSSAPGINESNLSPLSSNQQGGDCSNHPSHYMTGPGAQRRIHREMREQIASKIGNADWADFNEDYDFTGLGFSVSKDGGGVNLSWSIEKQSVFATKYYGTGNKLVFAVAYEGEAEVAGNRDLNLNFSLRRGSSLVDGIPYATFSSGNFADLVDVLVSSCLLENLAGMADSIEINLGDGGGWIPKERYDAQYPGATLPRGGSCAIRYKTCWSSQGEQQCTSNVAYTGGC